MLPRLTLLILILACTRLRAQPPSSLIGEYYLSGVMETASGFRLNADSTFDFFFSQGALDRTGTGKWSVKDNVVTFNSAKRPPLDFALVESRKVPGDSIVVMIKDKNTVLLRYVDVLIKGSNGSQKGTTDADGTVIFPSQDVEAISLIFQLCPERYSEFVIDGRSRNYFVFRFEPWLMDVFFDNFQLTFNGNRLSGRHPLLRGEDFQYSKNTAGQ